MLVLLTWLNTTFFSFAKILLNVEITPFQISLDNLTTITGIALEDPGYSEVLVEKFSISYSNASVPHEKGFKYTYVCILIKRLYLI